MDQPPDPQLQELINQFRKVSTEQAERYQFRAVMLAAHRLKNDLEVSNEPTHRHRPGDRAAGLVKRVVNWVSTAAARRPPHSADNDTIIEGEIIERSSWATDSDRSGGSSANACPSDATTGFYPTVIVIEPCSPGTDSSPYSSNASTTKPGATNTDPDPSTSADADTEG